MWLKSREENMEQYRLAIKIFWTTPIDSPEETYRLKRMDIERYSLKTAGYTDEELDRFLDKTLGELSIGKR